MSEIEFQYVAVQQGNSANKVHLSRVMMNHEDARYNNRIRVGCGSKVSGNIIREVARYADVDQHDFVRMITNVYKDQVCQKCAEKVGA
jgi:hypothetical protein